MQSMHSQRHTGPAATQTSARPIRVAHYPRSAHTAPGLWVLAGLSALLAACSSAPPRTSAPAPASRTAPTANTAAANAVLMRALSLIGTPYRWGGNTPEGGFDCSGLVNYVFADMLDLRLPRTSRELAAYQGPRIARAQLATADLVFFGSGGQVSHVGIYIGDGRFVHAPSSGGTVRVERLDERYWTSRYSGARRVLQ